MKIVSALLGALLFALFAMLAIEYITNASLPFGLVVVVSYIVGTVAFATARSTRGVWTRATLWSGIAAALAAVAVVARPWLHAEGGRGPFFGMGTLELMMIPPLLVSAVVLVIVGLILRRHAALPSDLREPPSVTSSR
jgi:hypothetical protein